MSVMKLKVLEQWLQGLEQFQNPKIVLEQYSTPPHIASCMINTMQASFEDIEGKSICDLGAGCGMLSLGAALQEASLVVGWDIDQDALEMFMRNRDDIEADQVEVVMGNVLAGIPDRFHKMFDTVVMNPPFGTKNNVGIDFEFLKVAMSLSMTSIYSLHKTSTRPFIMKKSKDLRLEPKVVAELRYNLPSSYKFHKKASVDIAVDFWRFEVLES